jgi:ATP-dependent Clp endopeptidase proteolytic subunit ClpP
VEVRLADRTELLAGLLDTAPRIGITGLPGTGKTSLARAVGNLRPVFTCDDGLPREHDELAAWVVANVPDGPVIVEGCAVPWAVRAGLKLDAILVLSQVYEPHPEAAGLGKGVHTVLAQIDVPKVYEMKTLALDLFGEVGYDFRASAIATQLTPDLTDIAVRLNSPGGEAVDGFAIYNLLAQHPAKVTVTVIGQASSAASYILQAADVRKINANAIIMTHKAMGGARGNAEALESQGKALRIIDDSMAGVYASRTGKSKEEASGAFLATSDTYWSADDAKAAGLVDEVLPDKAPTEALRACNTEKLRGAPASFLAAVAAARSEQPLAKDIKAMDLKDLIGGLAALTPEQRGALVKHAESESKLAGLFVTPELEAQAKAGKAVTGLLGKDGDALVGAVAALQATETRAKALETTVAELAAKDEAREINDLIAANRDKVTPDQRSKILAAYQAKTLTLGSIKAMVEMLPPIPGLGRTVRPAASASASADLKFEGKTYKELSATPSRLVALKKEQPELWSAMREAAVLAGEIDA